MSKVLLIDRSATELFNRCPRAFYWDRVMNISPVERPEALEVGSDIHNDLQRVAEAPDLDVLLTEVEVEYAVGMSEGQLARELHSRRYGWMAAFALFIEPRIRELYESTSVEHELILDRTPLWIPVTPDRILKHRSSGHVVYREYKSTISSSGKWLNSWKKAPQLHLGIKALQEDGLDVSYAQVMGLMKGTIRDGRLAHPYTWGYRHQGGQWTHDYNNARGQMWSAAPVWEFPGGIVEWVRRAGKETAEAQFPHTEPVFLNEDLLNEFVSYWTAQTKEIALMEEGCKTSTELRTLVFPMKTTNCAPAFGDPCPYRWTCWNKRVHDDPIGSGYYIEREPHHEVEIMLRRNSE